MPYLGNEVAPLVQALEGKELKLDSDGDSSITADTDDRVDVKVGGSDMVHVTSTGLGVGTNSPTDTNGFSRALDVNGSSGAAVYTRTDGSATNRTVFANSGTDGYVFNGGAGTLRFYSNATQHMTIDANGHITKPQTPAFCARGNYSTVSVNDEVWAFNSTSYGSAFNIGSHYNTSDGKFTAPIDGRYFFHFSTIINTQGTNLTLQIRVNNSATDQMHISQDESGWNTYSVSNIYNLSANDYVTVYVGGNYLLYGQTWSRFTGYLLG
mgnify:CR=1 FL=1